MKGNTFNVCGYTPSHLGWAPQLVVNNFGYDAGGWRVDRHPRLLADTSGDHRADPIVGFGIGVWVSRAQPDGRFETPRLVVNNFGMTPGLAGRPPSTVLGRHHRGGRADIVGFGNAGVGVARSGRWHIHGPTIGGRQLRL